MKVLSIELRNIRSHKHSLVKFGDGFNCITGGVGEGKTSILHALHFGLLGEKLGRSYDYLLREGEASGSVVLQLEHMGRHYRIMRALKRDGGRITQDPSELAFYEDDKLIASGKSAAVNDQVKAMLGIDEGLFKNAIWVQQEKLKDFLNMEPSKRQEILDDLFGISDFLKAWELLRPFEREYEAEKSVYERDVDVLSIEDLRKSCGQAHDELVHLQTEVERARSNLAIAESRYKEAEDNLRRLEDLRREADKLREERLSVKAKVESLKEEVSNLRDEIKKRQSSADELRERISQIEEEVRKRQEGLSEMGLTFNSQEEAQELRRKLEDEKATLLSQLSSAESRLSRLRQDAELLKREGRCPTCKRSLDEVRLGELIDLIERQVFQESNAIGVLNADVAKLNARLSVVERALGDLGSLWSRKDSIEAKLNDELIILSDLSAKLAQKEELLISFENQLASFEERAPELDLEELEKASSARDEMYKRYADSKLELELKQKELGKQSELVNQLKSRLEEAEKKLRRSRKVDDILKLVRELREVYKTIGPRLRKDLTRALARVIQQVVYDITAGLDKHYVVEVDESYTPYLQEGEYWRDLHSLSGGERTILALGYKIGVGQLVLSSRGRPLDLLILDEPTESLGPEDQSIGRLAEALSNLKGVEQIIAVTHSEDFARRARHVIRVRKVAGESSISYER